MEKTGTGVLSQNDLMQRLVQAKKVLNKVENGDYEKGNVNELPEAIKRAMIENPIPQISLSDSLDLNFVEKTKKLMENEGVSTKKSSPQKGSSVDSSDLVKQLTPIIENIVRKTVVEILDNKLNQILTAQQTMSINENLVLKVGDSIFKGKITGVNKSK